MSEGESLALTTAMLLGAAVLVVCVIWLVARAETLRRHYAADATGPAGSAATVPDGLTLAWGSALVGATALYLGSLMAPSPGVLLEPALGLGLASSGVAIVAMGWILLLVDVRVRKLPTELIAVMGALVVGAWGVYLAVMAAADHLDSRSFASAVGAPAIGALVWVAPIGLGVRLAGVGRGDLRLAPILGFALGTSSVPLALGGLGIAFATAAAQAIAILFKGHERRARFALGPHLLAGSWAAWTWGAVGPVLLA